MLENTDLIKLPELPVIEIVDDLIQVFKEFMVIRAALELRFFDWMAEKGPSTIDEISEGCSIDRDYISALIGMLFYLDIVRRSGEKYLLSPSANLHFVSTSNYYQGNIILALSEQQSPWNDLKIYLTSPDTRNTFEQKTVLMGSSRAEREIRGMIKNITTVISKWPGFKEAQSFLEIGTGHGLYAIAACQMQQSLKATVCTSPENIDLLRKNISQYEMEDRIVVSTDLPGSITGNDTHSIILASHVLYPYQDRLADIIRNMATHLSPGGLFVSNHWFIHESEGTGMQGLYELELAMHNRYHTIRDQNGFMNICHESGLNIFQTGVMRSVYGESIIHLAIKN